MHDFTLVRVEFHLPRFCPFHRCVEVSLKFLLTAAADFRVVRSCNLSTHIIHTVSLYSLLPLSITGDVLHNFAYPLQTTPSLRDESMHAVQCCPMARYT